MSELYETVSLSTVVKINSGIALPKIFKGIEKAEGEYQFFKVAQMNNDVNTMKGAKLRFTKSQAIEYKIKLFPKGSILIPKRGGAILTNKKRLLTEDASYDSNIMGLKANNEVLSDKYLMLFMQSINLGDYIDTSTIPQINNKHIKMMKISTPPLQEQKRIVAKLDTLFEKIDKAIALHQKNMDEADVFMGSVLNEVFGELEGKYEVLKLSTFASFKNGYAFKSKEFNTEGIGLKVIRIGNVLNLDKNPVYIKERDEFERYLLKENDIVISMTGTRTKKDYLFVRIVDTNDSYLNQRVGKIVNNEKSNHKFLYYFIQSSSFRDKIFKFETGAVNQGNMSGKDIMNSNIVNAPLVVQQKTVKYLDQISEKNQKLKSVQKEKMERLKALKASILDRAFRGDI